MTELLGLRILVVEDDDDLREVVIESLQMRGAETVGAEGNDAALEEHLREAFDVIVSDLRMPLGNGVDLAKAIQNCGQRQPVFLLFSGYSDLTNEQKYAAGIHEVLAKPLHISELVKCILKNVALLRAT